MGMFDYLGPVVQGFNQSTDQIRQRNQHEADLQAQRDNAVFEALANSDDPDIRAAAVTGLLTGNHPARALDKFLGKVGTHPSFETIKGLIGQGHQAFVGEAEETRRKSEATTSGGITGILGGAEKAGVHLTPEEQAHVVMGKAGAPPRAASSQKAMLRTYNGEEIPGWVDPSTRTFWDEWGNQRSDIASFRNADSNAAPPDPNKPAWVPGTVADTGQFPGEQSPGGWRIGRTRDGREVHEPAQPPPAVVPNVVPTPNGNVGVGRGGAEVPLPPSVAGAGRAVSPETGASSLNAIISKIEADIKPAAGILGSTAKAKADVAARRDAAAKNYGFESFAALQAAAGGAAKGVQEFVPPSGKGAAAPAPGGPPGPVSVGGTSPRGGGARNTPPPQSGAPAPADATDPLGLFR